MIRLAVVVYRTLRNDFLGGSRVEAGDVIGFWILAIASGLPWLVLVGTIVAIGWEIARTVGAVGLPLVVEGVVVVVRDQARATAARLSTGRTRR